MTIRVDGEPSRTEKIIARASEIGGTVTYVGQLAILLHNESGAAYKVVDEEGNFLAAYIEGMPAEDLIELAVSGERAEAKLATDGRYLASALAESGASGDAKAYKWYFERYQRNLASQYIAAHTSPEKIMRVFKVSRQAAFRHSHSLYFEKLLNRAVLDHPGDIGETFDRLGYSPVDVRFP